MVFARNFNRERLALLAPAAIVLFGFMVLPMCLMGLISLLKPASFGGVDWGNYSFDAYVKFLFERDLTDRWVLNTDYLGIFVRSFLLALGTVILTAAIGFPTALYIALQPKSRQAMLLMLISIPLWTNLLVRTYAWMLLLRNGGLIEQSLQGVGVPIKQLGLLYTPTAVFIGLVYSYLPFMVMPMYASLEKFDWRLMEAAFDLGATRLRAMRRVMLPIIMPGVMSACLLVFVPTLGAYYIPELLGGGKSLMIGSLIQNQFGVGYDWPFGAALAFALLGMVLLGMTLYGLRFKRSAGL